MATRSIMDQKERLATILIAPLMTCSARLPVYTLIIGAFIPARDGRPGRRDCRGLVLFALYIAGIAIGAMLAALRLSSAFVTQSRSAAASSLKCRAINCRDCATSRWACGSAHGCFLRRAGTIIFVATIILWVLLSFPKVPVGSGQSQVEYSIAGRIADPVLNRLSGPIGFNHDIALALIPAMAAREVAVSALGTVYAIDADDEEQAAMSLGPQLWPPTGRWQLRFGLSGMVHFCPAMHLYDRGYPARNQWLEMASVHGWLSLCTCLCGGGHNLLDSNRLRFIAFVRNIIKDKGRTWRVASTR